MKRFLKYILGFIGLFLGVVVLASCTANFCSAMDTSRILYVLDKGVTIYDDEQTITFNGKEIAGEDITAQLEEIGFTNLESPVYAHYTFDYSVVLRDTILPNSFQNGYFVPSIEYFKAVDREVLKIAVEMSKIDTTTITSAGDSSVNGVDGTVDNINELLNRYGFVKFLDKQDILNSSLDNSHELYVNYNDINENLRDQTESTTSSVDWSVPGSDFLSLYTNQLNTLASTYRSCISTIESDEYKLFGMYESSDGEYEQVQITQKDWGYAWGKGFFEGFLIYPIAFVIDSITMGFVGGDTSILVAGNGWAQVGAILLVTLIVRTFLMLVTLPATISQTKMQLIQPELMRIQQKYPNSNTNNYEKQRMGQEMQALYKKNKIHPFAQILVLIIQFPIFICVWGALSASSPLSTGNFYNMNLSMSIWNVLTNTSGLPGNDNGWWTAFGLIIIMTLFQVLATLIPGITQKIQRKRISKLGKNPAQDKQNRTMKIVQWVMLVVIVFMGFTLPSGMGVYWIGGALFSIAQSLIVFFIGEHKRKNKKKVR